MINNRTETYKTDVGLLDRNTILNQSARVFSLGLFYKIFIEICAVSYVRSLGSESQFVLCQRNVLKTVKESNVGNFNARFQFS